jgi:beta-1,2-mannobiose phosphorylase / 1,2-beta-oligomannan phosphorylase
LATDNGLFQRYSKNPILSPKIDSLWESKAVFNCSTLYDGKNVNMLYRAIGEYDYYISRIGYAQSVDGYTFERRKNPVIDITEDYEKYGIEDPRITMIDDDIFITYVVLSDYVKFRPIVSSALAVTKDFMEFSKMGIISNPVENCKDVVLFPEKFAIKNSSSKRKESVYLSLRRPSHFVGPAYGTDKPSIWIYKGSSLAEMNEHKVIMKPEQDWENLKIGAGPAPIKTKKGWLLIYHGVSQEKVYRAGAVILDLNDPSKVIYRCSRPILEPFEPYERFGDVNNVVFPTGTAIIDNNLFLYYGGADKVCCVATVDLDSLLDYITGSK